MNVTLNISRIGVKRIYHRKIGYRCSIIAIFPIKVRNSTLQRFSDLPRKEKYIKTMNQSNWYPKKSSIERENIDLMFTH